MQTETVYQFDTEFWTATKHDMAWLKQNGATLLREKGRWSFYEHPIYGDEAPVLAVVNNNGPHAPVWNTQDMDVPHPVGMRVNEGGGA